MNLNVVRRWNKKTVYRRYVTYAPLLKQRRLLDTGMIYILNSIQLLRLTLKC